MNNTELIYLVLKIPFDRNIERYLKYPNPYDGWKYGKDGYSASTSLEFYGTIWEQWCEISITKIKVELRCPDRNSSVYSKSSPSYLHLMFETPEDAMMFKLKFSNEFDYQ